MPVLSAQQRSEILDAACQLCVPVVARTIDKLEAACPDTERDPNPPWRMFSDECLDELDVPIPYVPVPTTTKRGLGPGPCVICGGC